MENYYQLRSIALVKDFDVHLRTFRQVLYRNFSNAEVSQLSNQMLCRFMEVLPRLPYVGGDKNPLTNALITATWFAVLSDVLNQHGYATTALAEAVESTSFELFRQQTKLRRTRQVKKSARRVGSLRPLLRHLLPATPALALPNQGFVVTYVDGADPSALPPIHGLEPNTVVWLSPETDGEKFFRHTYRVNYLEGRFCGIQLVRAEVAKVLFQENV